MGRASKEKGSQFERDICVKLSLFVSHGQRKDCFWRSAMSGGRATVHAAKGNLMKSQVGDLSAVAPEAHAFATKVMVECKHVKNLEMMTAVVSHGGELTRFWHKLEKDASKAAKFPMLVARQNAYPILTFMRPIEAGLCFGPVNRFQRAELFTNGNEAYSVGVYFLQDLLRRPYNPEYFS